jgi:hypothetical protein
MHLAFNEMNDALAKIFESDFLASGTYLEDKLKQSEWDLQAAIKYNLRKNEALPAYFERKLTDIVQLSREAPLPQKDRQMLEQLGYYYPVVFHALSAKHYFRQARAAHSPEIELEMLHNARASCAAAENLLPHCGIPRENTWLVQAFVLKDEPIRVPELFKKFTDGFGKAVSEADARLSAGTQQALSPLPPRPPSAW